MRILCHFGRHEAADGGVWNNGHYFARCRHCSDWLVRPPEGSWKGVPRGYEVVMKRMTEFDVDWTAWEREAARRENA